METFDYQDQFERIKKDIAHAFTKALDAAAPSTGLQLRATKVWVQDDKDPANWQEQREAIRKDKTWGVPVYADVEMFDRKTGKVVSTASKLRLAMLPKNTSLGSFIVDGKHYQVNNQLRRKPGIYITEKENREIKAEFLTRGRSFDLEVKEDKDTGVPKFYVVRTASGGGGSVRAELYPLLSRLGVSDAMLAKAWGTDVLAANKAISAKKSDSSVIRIAKALRPGKYEDAEGALAALKLQFAESDLQPEVTKTTVGSGYKTISPLALVDGSKQLLLANAGTRAPDDRNSLEYKKALGLADIMRERFVKENGELTPVMEEFRRKALGRLKNQVSPPKSVRDVLAPGQFTNALKSFFTQSSLSNNPDQTNPVNMINGMSKITVLGEGGISDPQRVGSSERSVHPSQLGFVDPIHTPDSEKIGLVMTLPVGVTKSGDDLKASMMDARTGKARSVSPSDMRNLVLSFPDQFKDGKPIAKQIKALVNGEQKMVDASKVDVVLRTSRQAFSVASNTIPFLESAQGVRAQMATKMLEQAIPLKEREAPLVQVKAGRGTMESAIGSGFSIRAAADGVVKSVSQGRIVVETPDGEMEYPLYNNLPLNNKSFLHADITERDGRPLAAGDEVKKGDVLADSNFTRNGELALGTNLRAAYIPWKGYNFEDGIVITESAQRKLTSEHLHEHSASPDRVTTLSLAKHTAYKSSALTPEQRTTLDDGGVVKKGTVVKKGDPLWVGVRDNKYDADYRAGKRMRGLFSPIKGFEETWEGDVPGKVVDVVKQGGRVKVYVKTEEPAQIGDKLTNRHGGKGIITRIIPDGEAPMDENGDPVDILLNPAGIVSRINPSQILETAAAKIATTDKPYIVNNFSGDSNAKTVKGALDKAGVSDLETLYDPHSKEPLGKVLVGPQYILKLSKQATSQFAAREEGKYDINRQPSGSGEEGTKSLDLITMYSMLAHGARANLREMATYKSEQNDDFWMWLRGGGFGGKPLPAPKPTFAYKKFEAYLKGAGANVTRTGSKIALGPMTDLEVDKLSAGEIKEPIFMRADKLNEEVGGLMDSTMLGGRLGERWGHIELAEPIPNPVFEAPIRALTGLKQPVFDSIIRGEMRVNAETGEVGEEGITGGAAIKSLLSKVDVDKEIDEWTHKAKTTSDAKKLDIYNKRLKYLRALKKLKLRPEDAYMQTKIPVIPPVFRQIAEMEDGSLSAPGLNMLYRDIGLINKELKWQHETPYVTDNIMSEFRGDLYKSVKALAGFTSPIAYYPEKRRPKGIVEQIKGSPAKTGYFQDKLLKRRQDIVGRGTIIPEPKLGIDEVALPEDMSWNLFGPFVRRRMVNQMGYDAMEAMDAVKDRTPAARSALDQEMSARPVMLNRAPSLHKFSIMAFKPQITDGKAIKIPPLVVKGFNADFDGDAMTVHVPILDDAVREAQRMLPSNNLYNPGTGQIMIKPQNEASLGLFLMSQDPKKRGEIADILPPEARAKLGKKVLTQSTLDTLLRDVAEEIPRDHSKVVDKLKQMGDEHAYRVGFTVGLDDLTPDLPGRAEIFAKATKALGAARSDDSKRSIVQKANDELDKVVVAGLAKQKNNFALMVDSGARGNMNQLKQIVSAPFSVPDYKGNDPTVPIMTSFAEGLPFSDYWSTLYGARAAAVDKQLQTSEPGAFNKDIMASAVTNVISKDDCMTNEGITVGTTSEDAEDRFLAKDITIGSKVLARAGAPVRAGLLKELRRHKINDIKVRSPLTCKMPKGTCAKCYGLNEHGQTPSMGDNIGATSGQALSEPLTQMTMRTFHQGGISGTRGVISGYEAIDKLFKMHKIKRGKAALAPRAGEIKRVEDVPGGGGKNVFIGDAKKPVFVEHDMWDSSMIRKGTKVEKGDIISKGIVQPQELVELKGMADAQNYVAGAIQEAYKGQGIHIKRRAVETVVRSVGNTTRILDGGSSDFLPGDIAPWTAVKDFNAQSLGKRGIDEVLGHTLLEDVPGTKKGVTIDERIQTILRRAGKGQVEVGPRPILDKPELRGLQRIPMLREDWMSQMGYRELSKALVRGATQVEESDLHGYAPVPAFVYGAEFGAEGGVDILGGAKSTSKSKTEGVY